MATLYVGGRVFDGEKVLDGHAVLEEGGKVKRCPRCGAPLQDGRCRCAVADNDHVGVDDDVNDHDDVNVHVAELAGDA